MKKLLSLIASLCLCAVCAFGLSACAENGKDGSDGKDGKDGVSVESAYFDDDGNLIIKLTDGKELNCGQVKPDTQESLHYRPVVEDGKIAGYSVKNIGNVTDTEIIIPSKYRGLPVTGIDENAFYGCDWISGVTIPDSVKSIGKSAFSKCENIKSVRVNSVADWCNISFANTSANPMYFAAELYEGDKLVENIVIPDSVTSIPDYAFYGCGNIKSVTIPDSVKSIGESAFAKCENIRSLHVDSVEKWCGISFANLSANPMYFATEFYEGDKLVENLVIPDSVTAIPDYAFHGCGNIISVTIPDSVKSIGESAFSKCENIKSVRVNSVADWCNISFANLSANPMYFATELYEGDKLVENAVIPDSVTSIPDYAFYGCGNIKSVTIGKGVTSIGCNCFYGCGELESVKIGGKVKEMGELAFADCPSLKTLEIGSEVEIIGEYAFLNCESIESLTIPASVKRIEEAAFMSCTGIATLNLNEGLEYIGDSAFAGCASLAEFNMPQSVTDIGFGVLMFGSSSGFDPIDGTANQVNRIVLSDKLTEIPDFAFSFCAIETIALGDKVTKINYSAFYGCDKLESVVIPKSVTRITSFAFYRCPMLNTVYFTGTAEEWSAIKIGKSGNDTLTGANDTELAEIYYYSEEQAEGCWHYVGGVPTKW